MDLQPVRDPLRRHHDRQPGGFRTIWLNAVGWSALVGAGLVVGSLLALTGLTWPVALPAGVLVAWAIVLALDYRRWLRSTSFVGGDFLDATTGRAVIEELARRGIEAEYEERLLDEEDGGGTQRGISCRERDAEKVRTLLNDVRSR